MSVGTVKLLAKSNSSTAVCEVQTCPRDGRMGLTAIHANVVWSVVRSVKAKRHVLPLVLAVHDIGPGPTPHHLSSHHALTHSQDARRKQ